MQSIILASQSPRRKQLLEWANIDFEVQVSNADEDYPSHLPISEIPVFIARVKAEQIRNTTKVVEKPILAADTIVVVNNEVLGKPSTKEEAFEMLQKLNGKKHAVITGVVILMGEKEISFAETTFVEFNIITDEELIYYINKYEPYDKAGSYAIQEWIGVVGIKSIDGDFYNVMGLPINRVYKYLKQL